MQKRAQVTIFVIISILIVASIATIFYLRVSKEIPKEAKEIEKFFVSCAEEKMKEGARIAGSQAGYIELPAFEAGSSYMPFSSQLDFFGLALPYWFYISGNGVFREQIPSISKIEKDFSSFLEKELQKCELFGAEKGKAKVSTKIGKNEILAKIEMPIVIDLEGKKFRITKHEAKIRSKLGKFYHIANMIYKKEQEELFLEKYTRDVIALYLPTSSFELSCEPKIWQESLLEKEAKEAIEGNIGMLKVKGKYYRLAEKEHSYFVVQLGEDVEERVAFLYSQRWPTKFDMHPADSIIVVKPTPLFLGECFLQYNFVYDISFPVLIQIYDTNEIFQFPVVVSVEKNKARVAIEKQPIFAKADICERAITNITIFLQDIDGNAIDGNIIFKCLNQICDIGKTEKGVLVAKVPQCVNAFLVASSEGFAETKIQLDTIKESYNIIKMKKLYDLQLNMNAEKAIVSFSSSEYSTTVRWPEQKNIKISEGTYDIDVFAYSPSSLTIPSHKTRQCTKVPRGILGIFGIEKEKCFDIEIPEYTMESVPVGGGTTKITFEEEQLRESKIIKISVGSFDMPRNIEELQKIYEKIEGGQVFVEIK